MEDKIEILMPTYNGERYLREQIDSILLQSYQNIKIIISDDASTDSTPDILKEYQKKDNRVEVYYQENNLGIIKNIEFLLQKVNAPFFMLADQDDYWLKEKVEKSIDVLKEENADLVFGDLEVVDSNLNKLCDSFNDYMLLSRKISNYINTNKLNYLYNCITGCTVCAKSDVIDKILPLPSTSKYVIHDYWIALMVSLNGRLAYIPEKLIKYRQHGNNQVGMKKISHGFQKFEQVRNWFLEVKLGIFGTYMENQERFPKDVQELNKKGYDYFQMIENKKYFNFKGWTTYHELYKTETFIYYLENFLIFNMPLIAKCIFYIRLWILKLLGKRK